MNKNKSADNLLDYRIKSAEINANKVGLTDQDLDPQTKALINKSKVWLTDPNLDQHIKKINRSKLKSKWKV